jgi:hypothetical protein
VDFCPVLSELLFFCVLVGTHSVRMQEGVTDASSAQQAWRMCTGMCMCIIMKLKMILIQAYFCVLRRTQARVIECQ